MNESLNESLKPVPVDFHPGPKYAPTVRPFQGIPGIERHPAGRLFATWYSCRPDDSGQGGDGEGHTNYIVLAASDDDGNSWQDPLLVIDPPGHIRAFDSCLWIDPRGRLWLFWAQSLGHWDGRGGVWAIRCDKPDAADPTSLKWSAPRRLCHGIMMNKPVVLRNGTWLLPAAVWLRNSFRADMADRHPDTDDQRLSNVIASTDEGDTWTYRGGADVPDRTADEHMVVELRDGRLWMLVRTRYGIGQSFSDDAGVTWSLGEDSGIAGPNSRFHIRRLNSGRLLLVNHKLATTKQDKPPARSHLTAWLSDDDGATWQAEQLIDERVNVSYPDAVEGPAGQLWIVYDWERMTAGHVLLCSLDEHAMLASRTSPTPMLVSAAGSGRAD